MDSLHKPDKKWYVTREIDVSQFGMDANNATLRTIEPFLQMEDDVELLQTCLGIGADESQAIIDSLDPGQLRCARDLAVHDPELTLAEPSLETLKLLTTDMVQEEAEESGVNQVITFQRQSDVDHRVDHAVLDSYRAMRPIKSPLIFGHLKEIVMTVVTGKPYNTPVYNTELAKKHGIRIDKCFLVLGSQRLTELRDVILCPCDWTPLDDFSEKRELADTFTAAQKFKAGVFYVNGVFYVDSRHPDVTDITEVIMEWARRREGQIDGQIGPFKKAAMEDTKFDDLRIRLGQPYVYIHQGQCEHVIIFSDLRLAHGNDPQERSAYPVEFAKKIRSVVRCQLCSMADAEWIVNSKQRLPYPNMFFCDACYEMFCLDKNGKKAFDFKMAPFLGTLV